MQCWIANTTGASVLLNQVHLFYHSKAVGSQVLNVMSPIIVVTFAHFAGAAQQQQRTTAFQNVHSINTHNHKKKTRICVGTDERMHQMQQAQLLKFPYTVVSLYDGDLLLAGVRASGVGVEI